MFEDEQLQGGAKITEKEQGADQIDPEVKLSSGGPTISSIQSTIVDHKCYRKQKQLQVDND